jgi:hypothetical protein
VVLMVRARLHGARSGLWLDAAIGALATMALASAVLHESIVASSSGSLDAVLSNLAYPVSDILLLGLVVAVYGVVGWRPRRTWLSWAPDWR